ncbi:MAG TPA: 50S ribosomal protein L18 [Candidatus Moranbacteria bacterium]|nr:50S ribosomal protein L18 [Candidatus Moranbacteria bacterium]
MRAQRQRRVRSKISGTAQRPRLAVFRSLRSMYVQAIDDVAGKTLAAVRLEEVKGASNTVEGARELGKLLSAKLKGLGIEKAVFDRAGYRYHGRVRALAEGAREGGLSF